MFSARASLGDARELQMPVNLIVGTETRRTARTVCELLLQRLPNAQLINVDGAAHLAPISDAQRINPVFEQCLDAGRCKTTVARSRQLRSVS